MPGLVLAPCVDVQALAARYELTGGFIKNAVLSALLLAIGRNKVDPAIEQRDLIRGCKLQMRGSMAGTVSASSFRVFDETETAAAAASASASSPIAQLELSAPLRENLFNIVRFEQARATIFGTWFSSSSTYPSLDSSSSSSFLGSRQQNAAIVCLAGPSGALLLFAFKTGVVSAIDPSIVSN